MHSKKSRSRFSFCIGFFLLLISPSFFPSFRPLFFAPYLILSIYRFPLFPVLLRGILCGTLFDLASSHPFFGLTPLIYCITLLVLYTQKFNFFEDKLSTVPLMCGIFSLLFTCLEAGAFALFGGKITLSWRWALTDLLGMVFFDLLYALFFFALPFLLTGSLGKMFNRRRAR